MSPRDYIPLDRLAGGHRMTLAAWGRPRYFPQLPSPTPRYFDVASDARVLVDCHWHHDPRQHPTLIALHGLEGSSAAHYMLGMADKAFKRGFNVLRVNQRNCGGTEALSAGLYHSGLTQDPLAILNELIEVDRLPSIAFAGYSLGGNLALKLAGELGSDAPPALRSIAAVSPTIDLAACVAALEQRQNLLYQWNFVRNLKRRMHRKGRLFPGRFPIERLASVRTVRAFDEAFTAPYHGFANAADYYHRASARRVIDRIQVPALVISAEDDPFVPWRIFADLAGGAHPHLSIMLTPCGGHCGFLSADQDRDDGYWAESTIVEFSLEHALRLSRQGLGL